MIKNKEQYNAYHREYRKRPNILEKWRAYVKNKMIELRKKDKSYLKGILKYKKANPDKIYAQVQAQRALRLGQIKKESCVICKSESSLMHHNDYSKPLEVVWVCKSHHREIHYANRRKEISVA